jgi:hypothetical protein
LSPQQPPNKLDAVCKFSFPRAFNQILGLALLALSEVSCFLRARKYSNCITLHIERLSAYDECSLTEVRRVLKSAGVVLERTKLSVPASSSRREGEGAADRTGFSCRFSRIFKNFQGGKITQFTFTFIFTFTRKGEPFHSINFDARQYAMCCKA